MRSLSDSTSYLKQFKST